jgi:hypothetical protein
MIKGGCRDTASGFLVSACTDAVCIVEQEIEVKEDILAPSTRKFPFQMGTRGVPNKFMTARKVSCNEHQGYSIAV